MYVKWLMTVIHLIIVWMLHLHLPFRLTHHRCAILTESCHRFLDVTGPLQVGGLPQLPTTYQVQHQYFHGCISDLYIDHNFIDLNS